jgi:hypothetical protein
MSDHNDYADCPHCRNTDGYVNAGRTHWFRCDEHKTMWCAGSNLFSSWKEQTYEEQQAIWDRLGLNDSTVVDPVLTN